MTGSIAAGPQPKAGILDITAYVPGKAGAKGKARKTKSSITNPSKTRSIKTVARLELMAMSSCFLRT